MKSFFTYCRNIFLTNHSIMKTLLLTFTLMFCLSVINAQDIKLLVRADDIGSSHNANLACIESFKNGIAQSVEVMVPCSWFEEAAKLLRENPGYDVGVHLVMTSEWENYKWRPLTAGKSFTDQDGYFRPMVWPNDNYPEDKAFAHSNWKLKEVEKELRAQIELALKKIPQVSHLSTHMGFTSANDKIGKLVNKLAKEYGLYVNTDNLVWLPGFSKASTTEETINNFVVALKNLEAGTFIFVEHPGFDNPEARAIGNIGYEHVAPDREMVTKLFTSEKVKN